MTIVVAEYGGAPGGLVNVVQKSGSNEWPGSVFIYNSGSAFDAAPNRQLMQNPQIGANAGGRQTPGSAGGEPPAQERRVPQSFARFMLGGYLVKDRLWIFGGAAPAFHGLERTVKFAAASGAPERDQSGFDYGAMMSKGFDYITQANTQGP